MEQIFESIDEVNRMAKGMGLNIEAQLQRLPEILVSEIYFRDPETEDDLYEAEGWFSTLAKFPNGDIYPLAKVSEQYQMIQHYDAIGQVLMSMQEFEDFGLDKVNIALSDMGGRCWLNMTSKEGIEVIKDDIIFPTITLENSADTKKRFGLAWGALRQICTNGMKVADSRIAGGTARKIHKKGSLNLDEEIQIFESGFHKSVESLNSFKDYAKIELPKDIMEDVYDKTGFSEKQIEEIVSTPLINDGRALKDTFKNGVVNGWDAYNSATQFITHGKNNNPGTAIERGTKLSTQMDKLIK